MYVDIVHACCLWRPEVGVGHPIAGVKMLMSLREGAGDQTQVLCRCSLTPNRVSSEEIF